MDGRVVLECLKEDTAAPEARSGWGWRLGVLADGRPHICLYLSGCFCFSPTFPLENQRANGSCTSVRARPAFGGPAELCSGPLHSSQWAHFLCSFSSSPFSLSLLSPVPLYCGWATGHFLSRQQAREKEVVWTPAPLLATSCCSSSWPMALAGQTLRLH